MLAHCSCAHAPLADHAVECESVNAIVTTVISVVQREREERERERRETDRRARERRGERERA